jgi:urea transport system substrate-binding protein
MVEILEPPVYLPLGETQMDEVLARVVKDQPDLIINTINGDTNTPFFRVLRGQRKFDKISTISFSVGKQELGTLDPASLVNDYIASSYFENLESDTNKRFVAELQKKSIVSVTDAMVTAYCSVHLWAKAVEVAGTEKSQKVSEILKNQSFEGPVGKIWFDPESNHAYRKFLLGKIEPDGSFKIINLENNNPIRPEPYPRYRSKEGWDKFLDDLFNKWNKNWQPIVVNTAAN